MLHSTVVADEDRVLTRLLILTKHKLHLWLIALGLSACLLEMILFTIVDYCCTHHGCWLKIEFPQGIPLAIGLFLLVAESSLILAYSF